jgi:hypothetical protein
LTCGSGWRHQCGGRVHGWMQRGVVDWPVVVGDAIKTDDATDSVTSSRQATQRIV